MKQVTALFALLVTTSLATGCNNCDPAGTAIYWTFTDASNHTTTSCSAAGVATLRIFVNGNAQTDDLGHQDLQCAGAYDNAGGAVVAVYSANDQIQVEAYDAQGNLLYLSTDFVPTSSCGLKSFNANLTAQQGTLTVNLTGFAQCPLTSYVWYSLTDVTDPTNPTSYSIVDGLHQNATAVPCAGAIAFDVVPFGNYRLDWIQIVQPTSNPATPYAAVLQNCSPQALAHDANDVFTVPLAPATSACAQ